MGRTCSDDGNYAVSMRERTQLLQRFKAFHGCSLQTREALQESTTICVNSDMTVGWEALWQPLLPTVVCAVACVRYGRATEIQGSSMVVEHNLDDVGIVHVDRIPDRRAGGGHMGITVAREVFSHLAYQRWFDERLVTLHVDDDAVAREAATRDDFCKAIRAGGMPAFRHDGFVAVMLYRLRNIPVVGCDE